MLWGLSGVIDGAGKGHVPFCVAVGMMPNGVRVWHRDGSREGSGIISLLSWSNVALFSIICVVFEFSFCANGGDDWQVFRLPTLPYLAQLITLLAIPRYISRACLRVGR